MKGFVKRIVKSGLEKVASGMGIRQQLTDIQDTQEILRELRYICCNIQDQVWQAPDGLPIPPARLRELTWPPSVDLRIYFGDRTRVQSLLDRLERHGVDLEDIRTILEFGCGNGSVIRQFHSLTKPLRNAKLYGTDINSEQIKWCQENLPFAEFGVNDAVPPLKYQGDQFDFIYSYSVFTHLSEPQQTLWINELSRVLKPGGYLLITVHGDSYLQSMTEIEKERFRAGQLVVQYPESSGIPQDYVHCCAFHPDAYVREKLVTGFEILDFVPGGSLFGEQESYLLRQPVGCAQSRSLLGS